MHFQYDRQMRPKFPVRRLAALYREIYGTKLSPERDPRWATAGLVLWPPFWPDVDKPHENLAVWQHVAEYLRPHDIVRMSRVSREFRQIMANIPLVAHAPTFGEIAAAFGGHPARHAVGRTICGKKIPLDSETYAVDPRVYMLMNSPSALDTHRAAWVHTITECRPACFGHRCSEWSRGYMTRCTKWALTSRCLVFSAKEVPCECSHVLDTVRDAGAALFTRWCGDVERVCSALVMRVPVRFSHDARFGTLERELLLELITLTSADARTGHHHNAIFARPDVTDDPLELRVDVGDMHDRVAVLRRTIAIARTMR